MTYEMISMYRTGNTGNWQIDKETSVAEHEVTEESAEKFMRLLELGGAKHRVWHNQIIYFQQYDCKHATEYLFRK